MLANKKSLLALSIAASLSLTGCFSDNDDKVKVDPPVTQPTEPVVVAPETPTALSLVANINVVDSETLDVVASKVTFLENGTVSENIVDVDGNMLTTVDSTDGDVVFTKKDGAELTEVTLSVTADGYIGKSFLVNLTADEGATDVNAQLSLVSKTATGVASKSVEATVDASGTSADPIAATTEGNAKAAAGATVPAGVALQDANGDPITGAVSISVSGADASGSAANEILPEGLNAADAESIVKAAAVANIEMTDSTGKKVKKFSGGTLMGTMSIPANTMLNGEVIKTGDMLSLKSHNEDTGAWTAETNMVTVGALNAETNTFTGSFETDHLTFFASTVTVNDLCTDGLSLAISGATVPASGLYASIASSDASASAYLRAGSTTNVLLSPAQSKRFGISANATARVKVFDANGESWFDSGAQNEVDVCGSVPVTLANPSTVVNEDITISATCSDDSTVAADMSNAIVRYSLGNKQKSIAINAGGGTFTLPNLIEGSVYNVTVNARIPLENGSTVQTGTITAGGDSDTVTVNPVCETTTGSTGAT